tara:strand:- start:153 stop:416 length:264 start_codon:yes stop_codon:yes gene_type:complete
MVYRGSKKNLGRKPGVRYYTDKEMKMVGWCMNKGIFININPGKGTNDWFIEIKMNNKSHQDPKLYTGEEALDKMYEYYKYYYDKHNV